MDIDTVKNGSLEYSVGQDLLFSHNAETNPDLSVRWNFGNGNSSDTSPVTYTYIEPGVYVIEVEVRSSPDYVECYMRSLLISRYTVTIR